MNRSSARSAAQQRDALYLLFRMGDDRYALAAKDIVAILPLPPLKQVAEAPHWVAGLFNYRGQVLPVLDLSARAFARPAELRTSTRLVLVHYRQQQDADEPLLTVGLILERVSETRRINDAAFSASPMAGQPEYLGAVQPAVDGVLQKITVEQLLDADLRAFLLGENAAQVRSDA
ncbi:chemotaxis protein CheW [Pseudomonas marincola]|uniref:chemotaxis protein CheW n=1 Tax=Pseudomonas marincola TaxID=437900 RepID=UPI0008EEF8F2|nr:chemotaxis protein CheW [Pseudomonas marincola]SFT52387.1 chemotaxis-related protein WspB [Pseudomonas marincola]